MIIIIIIIICFLDTQVSLASLSPHNDNDIVVATIPKEVTTNNQWARQHH